MNNNKVISDPTFGVPPRSLLGNMGPGVGPATAVSLEEIALGVAATGIVASPGAPANLPAIADKRFLGNGSGATAVPVALSITQPGAGFTVTWAVGGITLALADDLAGVEGLSTTGLAARTGTSTWATRTITGTTSRLTVTNGDGVAGNPTLDISASYVDEADFQLALFWGSVSNSSGTDLGDLSDTIFLANVDLGDLAGCGNITTTGFTSVDMGIF